MPDALIDGRICTKCQQFKISGEFYNSQRDGRLAVCRICTYENQKKWRASNPDKTKAARERRKLRHPPKIKSDRVNIAGKICSRCKDRKPLTEFTTDRSNPDGHSGYCRPCARDHHSTWRKAKGKGLTSELGRKHRMRRFGLSDEDFLARLESQDYKCAICADELVLERGRGKNACIDHDHQTGKVRGILCMKCNTGLGMFNDRYEVVSMALSYLEKNK